MILKSRYSLKSSLIKSYKKTSQNLYMSLKYFSNLISRLQYWFTLGCRLIYNISPSYGKNNRSWLFWSSYKIVS